MMVILLLSRDQQDLNIILLLKKFVTPMVTCIKERMDEDVSNDSHVNVWDEVQIMVYIPSGKIASLG